MCYIEITTRCNMQCAHCCRSCGPIGKDMSLATYRRALAFASDKDCAVSIGGGEPTIHPRFWEMLGLALGSGLEFVWLATNGKKTQTALALAGLASSDVGPLSVALSQDQYHEAIDPRVVQAFKRKKLEIRTVRRISAVGRAAEWGDSEDCVCSSLIVRVDGSIVACGCPGAPVVGTVLGKTPGIFPEYERHLASDDFRYAECWTRYEKRKREAEELVHA